MMGMGGRGAAAAYGNMGGYGAGYGYGGPGMGMYGAPGGGYGGSYGYDIIIRFLNITGVTNKTIIALGQEWATVAGSEGLDMAVAEGVAATPVVQTTESVDPAIQVKKVHLVGLTVLLPMPQVQPEEANHRLVRRIYFASSNLFICMLLNRVQLQFFFQ
jgi:hypothetical protein